MSSLIQTVSYEAASAKTIEEKLQEHLGVQEVELALKGGEKLSGILTEIGADYYCVMQERLEAVIPKAAILWIRYQS